MDLCTRHSLFVMLIALLGCSSVVLRANGEVLKFFMHDDLLTVANASADVLTLPVGLQYFGTLVVFDDLITYTPDVASFSFARGRGFYLFDAKDYFGPGVTELGPGTEYVWTMVFDAARFESPFPRNSITFAGFDRTTDLTREISVIGGTGQFRYARGYATVSTYSRVGFSTILNITVNFQDLFDGL